MRDKFKDLLIAALNGIYDHNPSVTIADTVVMIEEELNEAYNAGKNKAKEELIKKEEGNG